MPSSGPTVAARARSPRHDVVRRRDADDDAGVGVALVARVLAHAVGDHALRLRGRGDDRAARAHAEAVDRAAVLRVVHEPVVGSAEERMAGVSRRSGRGRSAIADARCESRSRTAWPRGERRARAASRRCRARCGRARGRRARRRSLRAPARATAHRRRLRGARRVLDDDAAHRAGLDPQVDDARAEADLAAEPLDLVAHALDHADQAEGADVRLGDPGDLLGRAGA